MVNTVDCIIIATLAAPWPREFVLPLLFVKDEEMPMVHVTNQYHETILPLLTSGETDLHVCLVPTVSIGSLEDPHFYQYLLF